MPVSPLFWGEGSPTKRDYREKPRKRSSYSNLATGGPRKSSVNLFGQSDPGPVAEPKPQPSEPPGYFPRTVGLVPLKQPDHGKVESKGQQDSLSSGILEKPGLWLMFFFAPCKSNIKKDPSFCGPLEDQVLIKSSKPKLFEASEIQGGVPRTTFSGHGLGNQSIFFSFPNPPGFGKIATAVCVLCLPKRVAAKRHVFPQPDCLLWERLRGPVTYRWLVFEEGYPFWGWFKGKPTRNPPI